MTLLRDTLELAIKRLTIVGCDTPRLDAEVLLAHSLGRECTWLYLHPTDPLDENQLNQFEGLLRRREQREPVAYIIGHKEFFGLEFEVNPHVLIPRPETELLVETAIELSIINGQQSIVNDFKSPIPNLQSPISNSQFRRRHAAGGTQASAIHNSAEGTPPEARKRAQFTIIDVGTGSGCIAITLAKNLPGASIFALDASLAALQLARRNAERHRLADRITFLPGDLLESLANPVDLIISNPPYVSRPELAAAMPEVSRYEPRLALDGGEDGLDVIRRLLPQAGEKLKPGGSLLVEIGSTQGQAVRGLAEIHFPQANIQIKKDLAGLDRLLVVEL